MKVVHFLVKKIMHFLVKKIVHFFVMKILHFLVSKIVQFLVMKTVDLELQQREKQWKITQLNYLLCVNLVNVQYFRLFSCLNLNQTLSKNEA